MNETANQLIDGMNHEVQKMIRIAKEYTAVPISYQNSATKIRLLEEYNAIRLNFLTSYAGEFGGVGLSIKLEDLNPELSLSFNQYLIDHLDPIEWVAQAPSFVEYLNKE